MTPSDPTPHPFKDEWSFQRSMSRGNPMAGKPIPPDQPCFDCGLAFGAHAYAGLDWLDDDIKIGLALTDDGQRLTAMQMALDSALGRLREADCLAGGVTFDRPEPRLQDAARIAIDFADAVQEFERLNRLHVGGAAPGPLERRASVVATVLRAALEGAPHDPTP